MTFCLPKTFADGLIKSLPEDINTLIDMTSAERRAFFADTVGEANAARVNALFESKLLLKNQQAGLINWVEKVTGMKPETKKDLLSKVDRLETALDKAQLDNFLEDLVAQRLGFGVTVEQTGKIFELAQNVELSKSKITDAMPDGHPARLEYGANLVAFKEYIGQLKLKGPKAENLWDRVGEIATEIFGAAKGMVATFDNSFFGRQGLKTLFTSPTTWARNFKKSWEDIGRGLKQGQDAIQPVRAEIWSRKNATNGLYEKMKIDIGISGEEAFPTALPAKIPIFGRAFAAAETAFNGAALRMRADLADRYLAIMQQNGMDLTDTVNLIEVGKLVNQMTGRGSIPPTGALASKSVNAAFFSPRFVTSLFQTFTQPLTLKTSFARQQAALSLVKTAAGIASVLFIAEQLWPGSVDSDPRSSGFGKITFPNGVRVDVSGGLGSVVTLAFRLIPTQHNGKWGLWLKTRDGRFINLTDNKYGQVDALDIIEGFIEGKLAPVGGAIRDVYRGENYQGETPTFGNIAQNLVTPISLQNYLEGRGQDIDGLWLFILADALGLSTYVPRD